MFISQFKIQPELKNKNGLVLILTIWILSLLSIFTIFLSYRASSNVNVARRMNLRLNSYYLAKSGVSYAIDALNRDKRNEDKEDYLGEEWAKEISQGLNNGKFVVNITDEDRKINLNALVKSNLAQKVLENFPDLKSDIQRAIINWVASTNLPDVKDLYLIPPEATKPPVQYLEELLLINDLTLEMFDELKNVFSANPDNAKLININTAQFDEDGNCPALKALGLTDDFINKIKNKRAGEDGIMNTEDDKFFTDTDLNSPDFSTGDSHDSEIRPYLAISSSLFRIVSEGKIKNEDHFYTIEAVVDRNSNNRIVSWDEKYVSEIKKTDKEESTQ